MIIELNITLDKCQVRTIEISMLMIKNKFIII